MPHLTLEYTENVEQNVNFQDLFSVLHDILADVGGVNIDNCKSRAIRRDNYHIGAGEADKAFVHLELLLLEGRSSELKQEIGRRILNVLTQYYASSQAERDLQITVQIGDIQRSGYFKVPTGTY
ncbi:MAG: 5-carboxymethyl-2-hydroxymuconate Delta-isomerase [Acidiferrobacterales bacterium]